MACGGEHKLCGGVDACGELPPVVRALPVSEPRWKNTARSIPGHAAGEFDMSGMELPCGGSGRGTIAGRFFAQLVLQKGLLLFARRLFLIAFDITRGNKKNEQ